MPFRIRHTLVATAVSLAALNASAAVDMFLKIDGIEGESVTKGFEKQIQIESFSWGVSQTATAGGGGARVGKACPTDMHLMKTVDKATPPLIGSAVQGTVAPNAILIGLRTGGDGRTEPYLKIEMKNVLVSSYQTSGSGGSSASDAFSLNFGSMTVTYYVQDAKGQSAAVTTTFQATKC
jgi:type VI secretion system secreted protein Hcp